MRIENQCCTLEQAKRLKELGIGQKGLFVWLRFAGTVQLQEDGSFKNIAEPGEPYIECIGEYDHFQDELLGIAFTTSELGLMLGENRVMVIENVDNTEAIDRANHLIMLLENNIITAEEVNKRLVNDEQKQIQ